MQRPRFWRASNWATAPPARLSSRVATIAAAAWSSTAESPDTSDTNTSVSDDDSELQTVTSTVTTEDGEEVELPPVPVDDEQNYEVVSPPVGVTVPYLPEEATEKTVGGKKYFVHQSTYYRPLASDGETIYMVVEDPTRAG